MSRANSREPLLNHPCENPAINNYREGGGDLVLERRPDMTTGGLWRSFETARVPVSPPSEDFSAHGRAEPITRAIGAETTVRAEEAIS
jgi:hypothetical protein